MLEKIKRAFATRYLFDNWYLLLIRFVLAKMGFNVRLRARVSKCIFEMDPNVFARFVSRFSRGFIKSIKCVDGTLFVNDIEINNISDVIYEAETWARVLGWEHDTSCNCWVKNNIKFRRMYGVGVLEVFEEGLYSAFNVDGKVVIDVGAFVGDSAIYFASRGAKKVIAVEPHPDAFREMLDNIKLNNLENVVVPLNVGLASKPGKICIEKVDIEGTIGTYHRPGECDAVVPAITLGDVVSRYVINRSAVLKMNCEGCEFDVILNDYEHVRIFKELIIDIHLYASSEPLSKLLKVLAKDYLCKVVKRMSKSIMMVYCIRNW